jgi:hypothetical protein
MASPSLAVVGFVIGIAVLILAAMFAASRVGDPETAKIDALFLAFGAVLVTLQLCRALATREGFYGTGTTGTVQTPTAPTAPAAATAPAAPAAPRAPAAPTATPQVQLDETLRPELTVGLQLYVSSLSTASYTSNAGSRTWKSISPLSQLPGAAPVFLGCSSTRPRDMQFASVPQFTPLDGFSLGANAVTGPLSNELGLNGNQACSIVFVGRWTSDVVESVSLFRIYANTLGTNGISLTLDAVPPVSQGQQPGSAGQPGSASQPGQQAMAGFTASLKVGNSINQALGVAGSANGVLQFERGEPYALTVVKDFSRLSVYAVKLSADLQQPALLLSFDAGASMEQVRFSNVDMTVNETRNFPGTIMAFACFSRALSETDRSTWFTHYRENLRRFDASFMAMRAAADAASVLRTCPYDAKTCAACPATIDWSDATKVLASGPECLKAIDAFCAANPDNPRCACWKPGTAAFNSAPCVYVRNVYSGRLADAAGSAASATSCATDSAGPRLPPESDAVRIVKSLVTPENILAIGKAVAQMKGAAPSLLPDSSCHSKAALKSLDSIHVDEDLKVCSRRRNHKHDEERDGLQKGYHEREEKSRDRQYDHIHRHDEERQSPRAPEIRIEVLKPNLTSRLQAPDPLDPPVHPLLRDQLNRDPLDRDHLNRDPLNRDHLNLSPKSLPRIEVEASILPKPTQSASSKLGFWDWLLGRSRSEEPQSRPEPVPANSWYPPDDGKTRLI